MSVPTYGPSSDKDRHNFYLKTPFHTLPRTDALQHLNNKHSVVNLPANIRLYPGTCNYAYSEVVVAMDTYCCLVSL